MFKGFSKTSIVGVLVFSTFACSNDRDIASDQTTVSQLKQSMITAMDQSVDPCEDFYQYACGGWLQDNEINSSSSASSKSFSQLSTENLDRVANIILGAAQHPDQNPRLASIYNACMDTDAIETLGADPLIPFFEAISAVDDMHSLMTLLGDFHRQSIDILFDTEIGPDFSGKQTLYLYQGGMGLGFDKDLYFAQSTDGTTILDTYIQFMRTLLELTGDSQNQAVNNAKTIIGIETALAKHAKSPLQMRDVLLYFRPYSLTALLKASPRLPWNRYMESLGIADVDYFFIAPESYLLGIESVLDEVLMADLKIYLRWIVTLRLSNHLSDDFRKAHFEFYERSLLGIKEPQSRQKSCIRLTRSLLPHDLGTDYIESYFPGNSQLLAESMIEKVQQVFIEHLPALSWLDEKTLDWAVEKALFMENLIGYPDKWDDYFGLTLTDSDHFANMTQSSVFQKQSRFEIIGTAPKRREWHGDVTVVNAFYSPDSNIIKFPAGILQPPFFHRSFPQAVNYGAIGTVMGHELTHGFDNDGSYFGPTGIPGLYFGLDSARQFNKAKQCVENQYNQYEVLPDVFIDGRLTLGENIADMGGLKYSHMTYLKQRSTNQPTIFIEGLNDEQLFFVAAAQNWCVLKTEESERLSVRTNAHAPGRFRVIGPMSNYSPFAEAFGCPVGSAMRRETTCEVW